jgi:hypothetical protein
MAIMSDHALLSSKIDDQQNQINFIHI